MRRHLFHSESEKTGWIIFLYEELIKKREFEDLWILFKQLLTLSHGQALVERGISVNKDIFAPDIEEMSLTSIRLVQNSMLVNNM